MKVNDKREPRLSKPTVGLAKNIDRVLSVKRTQETCGDVAGDQPLLLDQEEGSHVCPGRGLGLVAYYSL